MKGTDELKEFVEGLEMTVLQKKILSYWMEWSVQAVLPMLVVIPM